MHTTVILGAGSSVDFGLPLGGELFDQALILLNSAVREWTNAREGDVFFDYNRAAQLFRSRPDLRELLPVVHTDDGNGRYRMEIDPVVRAIATMDHSPAYSLDTLALENPNDEELFRLLTAHLIIAAVRASIEDNNGQETISFFKRRIPNPRAQGQMVYNWIHLFCSMVRNEVTRDENTEYSVVSLNYDQVFERTARSVWTTSERDIGEFTDVFKVLYPHGKIHWDTLPNSQSSFSVDESEIIFAHNKPADFDPTATTEQVIAADRLIFLGFSFAQENVETLGLLEIDPATEIVYQNFGNNRGVDNRVKAIGFKNAQIHNSHR